MGRWKPDAVGRLERAALELYLARGFEQVTVAEIAERAGVTERTFFRYFSDKREVLFGGSASLQQLMVDAVAAAPEHATPIEAVAAAVEAAAVAMGEYRDHSRQRAAVIAANPGLMERELLKLAALAAALSVALQVRGVAPTTATFAGFS